MLAMFTFAQTQDPMARIGFGTVLREAFLRNTSYPHMVEDTLTELFSDPIVEAECIRVLGFTVANVRAVFGELIERHSEAWEVRFDAFRQVGRYAQEYPSGPPPAVRDHATELLNSVWANAGDASTFDATQLATAVSLPTRVVESVMNAFAYTMSPDLSTTLALRYFEGGSPFRVRPILRDPTSGTAVFVHQGLLVPAVREAIEQALKSDDVAWDVYSKHRGTYVETEALRLLSSRLKDATIRPGFEYFVPEPTKASEHQPADYTKLVESDGLVIVDDIAILLESKSVAMRAQSRTGHFARLKQDLRRMVGDAAEQARRARERIHNDGGLMLRNGDWLDLSFVREIHTVAVSLDDLSGIATVTTDLVEAGLLSDTELPWIVSLHDLRIIVELVERPFELVMYLRRRREPDVTRKFHAIDELDFFLYMYRRGLYVEPNPDRLHAELPQLGEPSVSAKRRHKAQPLEFITTQTGPLDAWYMSQLGIRQTASPKPALNANPGILALVDDLARLNAPGWLSMGTTLLEASAATQHQWSEYAEHLCRMTMQDGKGHTATVVGGHTAAASFVLVWATPELGQSPSAARPRLAAYLRAKKYQLRVARGLVLLFDPPSRKLVDTIFNNEVWAFDEEIEEQVATLKPVAQHSRSIPLARKARSTRGARKKRR
jgi:hypothetical protein